MPDYELSTEDGEKVVKLKLSDEDREYLRGAAKLFGEFASEPQQRNIILTPERKEMLAKLVAVVVAVT